MLSTKNTNNLVNVTPAIQIEMSHWELRLQSFIQSEREY
jgi:hypothetical protein